MATESEELTMEQQMRRQYQEKSAESCILLLQRARNMAITAEELYKIAFEDTMSSDQVLTVRDAIQALERAEEAASRRKDRAISRMVESNLTWLEEETLQMLKKGVEAKQSKDAGATRRLVGKSADMIVIDDPEGPRYEHDCEYCAFVGRWNFFDFYIHTDSISVFPALTLVARYGPEHEYTSGSLNIPPMLEKQIVLLLEDAEEPENG